LPDGAVSLTLPNNPNIRIMAMTAATSALDDTVPAGVLFETELTSSSLPKPRVARLSDTAKTVFALPTPQTFSAATYKIVSTDAPNLPIRPDDTWTITLSILMDAQPADGTLIGGFGDDQEANFLSRYDMGVILCPRGARRYIGKSASGICLYGGGFAVEARTPYDIGKWQVITATYDGVTVTLYKNGRKIGSGRALFNEAESTAKLAPRGASLNGPGFTGTIKGFTICNGALTPAAVDVPAQAAMTK
jgi:alpha-mannosidase